ncbi:MAG: hypothetical protein AB7S26_05480 [Sandaracinaceae bacterium]
MSRPFEWAAFLAVLCCGVAHAEDAEPSLPALCRRIVRAETFEAGPPTCRVIRRIGERGVGAALLRVVQDEGNSPESIRIAVREREGWRELGEVAEAIHQGHGMLGEMGIEAFALRDVIPGGAPEIEIRTVRWQGEPVDECGTVRGAIEWHAAVCERSDGEWRCGSLQTGGGTVRERRTAQEGQATGCAPVATDVAVPWRVDLAWREAALEVRVVYGEPPAAVRDATYAWFFHVE